MRWHRWKQAWKKFSVAVQSFSYWPRSASRAAMSFRTAGLKLQWKLRRKMLLRSSALMLVTVHQLKLVVEKGQLPVWGADSLLWAHAMPASIRSICRRQAITGFEWYSVRSSGVISRKEDEADWHISQNHEKEPAGGWFYFSSKQLFTLVNPTDRIILDYPASSW